MDHSGWFSFFGQISPAKPSRISLGEEGRPRKSFLEHNPPGPCASDPGLDVYEDTFQSLS